jgi:hypothetical protein
LSEEAIEEVAEMIDIVEVWNGQPGSHVNQRAMHQ